MRCLRSLSVPSPATPPRRFYLPACFPDTVALPPPAGGERGSPQVGAVTAACRWGLSPAAPGCASAVTIA